jgi:hypothetical protein
MTFKVFCRTSHEHPWELYGEFNNEEHYRAEESNIRAQGLYTRREYHNPTRPLLNALIEAYAQQEQAQ